MKTITKTIPVLGIIAITLILLIFIDTKEYQKHDQLDGYQKTTFSIEYDSNKENLANLVKEISENARENNVILSKNNNGNIYYSFATIDELINVLSDNFNVEVYDVEHENDSFIATYNVDDNKQIGYIKDFLANNKITYYLLDKLIEDKEILHDTYQVFYKSEIDYNNFINAVKTNIGFDITNTGVTETKNIEDLFLILILIVLILISLFYYTFEIYRLYYSSKKIGCMKLLGFDKLKITNIMVKNSFLVYLTAVFIIFILLLIFVKNITLGHLILIFLFDMIILLFTYYVSFNCVRIILNSYQTSGIIKNQNLASKIAKISNKIKFIVTILLIGFISFLFYTSNNVFNTMELYNHSQNMLGYGVIDSVSEMVVEDLSKEHTKLYQLLYDDTRLEILEVDFGSYFDTDEEYQEIINQEIRNNVRLYYGDVNKNYLKRENIKVYDDNDNLVNIDNIEDFSFIVPKDKKEIMLNLINIHLQEEVKASCINNPYEDAKIYYYDDQKIDTYRLNLDEKYIDSPVIRVIGRNVFGANLDWLNECGYVSIYGNGINDTGLKIKIVDNLENTNDILEEHFKEAGVYGIIDRSNFVSFDNYFSGQISIVSLLFSIVITSVILVGSTYTLISLQVITLYLKSEKQKVIVKRLLGFNKRDIFNKIINRNIISNVICFIISFIILIVIGKLDYEVFIISIILFMIIDIILLLLSIKFSGFSQIFEQLKGGNLWLQLKI